MERAGGGVSWLFEAVVEATSPLSNMSELVGRQNYIPKSTNPLST
jgi:hypothetical protein